MAHPQTISPSGGGGGGGGGGTTLSVPEWHANFAFVAIEDGLAVKALQFTSDQDLLTTPGDFGVQNDTAQLAAADIDSANSRLRLTIGTDSDDDELLGANDDVAAADAPCIHYVEIPEHATFDRFAVVMHRAFPDVATMSATELMTLILWPESDTDDYVRSAVGVEGGGESVGSSTTVAGSSGTIDSDAVFSAGEMVTGIWTKVLVRYNLTDRTRYISVFFAAAALGSRPGPGDWTAHDGFQDVAWIADDGPLNLRCGVSLDSTVATPTGFSADIGAWEFHLPDRITVTTT